MHDDKLILYIGRKPAMHQEKGQKRSHTSQPTTTKKMLKQITYIKGYESAQEGCREESQTRFGEQKDRLFGKAVRNKPNHLQRALTSKSHVF